MFTGIVQGVSQVMAVTHRNGRIYLALKSLPVLRRVVRGGSIAVNGVCLTLFKRTKTQLLFEIMPETQRKTTLDTVTVGSLVNVEPALRVGDELGGHLVQGHVDGVGIITKIVADQANQLVSIEIPVALKAYVRLHGSITLDGISLTIARLSGRIVTVSLIAETQRLTHWKKLMVGQRVNVEADIIAKYLKK